MASLLEEIEEIRNSEAPVLSDGSDIEGNEFSEDDDFTVDERRYVDAIGRELHHLEMVDALRARHGDDSDDDPVQPAMQVQPVDFNTAAPNWTTDQNNFVPRQEFRCTRKSL
ncbi:hypothetical protein RRG08_023896 [Elysia crispata]|uniref:Uncharacterized protein n=1 Tax=Elysia crispata TaxID=231223 RepID=A0AAE0ZZ83_9GAST|nr:hypothetical protein RRG08_023896 [Elysia crispata]